MKKRAFKSNNDIKSLTASLDILRSRYKKMRSGYRDEVYHLMGQAQIAHFALRRSSELRKAFVRHVKRECLDDRPLNLATEIMARIMAAKSRTSRQLAWKRGRVLEILRDAGIKAEKTAKEIKKRGGIEKIIGAASSLTDPKVEKESKHGAHQNALRRSAVSVET